MERYERPCLKIIGVTEVDKLLTMSEVEPGATDIGAPMVSAKESVWDEDVILYNINYNINKEEQAMKGIGLDKVKHFAVCLAITVSVAFAIKGMGTWYGAEVPNIACGGAGACLALLAGVGKEALDYIEGRKADFADILADTAGAAVGVLLMLLA